MSIIAKIYIKKEITKSNFVWAYYVFSRSQPAFLAGRRERPDVEAMTLGNISESIPQSLPFKAKII